MLYLNNIQQLSGNTGNSARGQLGGQTLSQTYGQTYGQTERMSEKPKSHMLFNYIRNS